ncbi:MAG: accessory Sec system protein Asp3 [Streptococcus sp.]|nr:accessory Sec system protein Asp3 [Streptococcus sp.]
MRIKEDKDNKIYWGSVSITSYLFGTTVRGNKDKSVVFKNMMIPSSQVIKEWSSSYNFQGSRRAPELPLLKRNVEYLLKTRINVIPEKTVFIEIVFKNRFGEVIGNKITKENEVVFVYPKDAYFYNVRIMSAGLEEFRFDFIEIDENNSKLEN